METAGILTFIQKCLFMPFYLACCHPFAFGMLGFSLLVYKKFPSIFGLVVSFSPIVICTFVFLEVILNSNRSSNSVVVEQVDCSSPLDGRGVREKKTVVLSKALDDRKNKDFNVLAAISSSSEQHKKEVHDEKKPFEDNQVKSALNASNISGVLNKDCQQTRPSLTKDDDILDSDQDVNSMDASMEGVLPMLDELHPLLEVESTQPSHVFDSYDSSIESSRVHDSDENDSYEEEAENQENEEEEDSQQETDRGTESVMKWTADDEKNLRDVGKIELERNQRLEHLIAKRRARNYQRSETEKNLIDLDNNEPTNVVEELSRLLVMIPPRKNPFDLPYGSEENDLIPGSAPSVLLPRKNPFELPCDHVIPSNEVISEDPIHQQEFVAFQSKDMFFKRYESFAIGASPIDYRQEKQCAKFHPYFVTERNDADEMNYGKLHHQLSSSSCSKGSSTVGSDSVSSASNHLHYATHNDNLEQEIQHGSRLISADNNRLRSLEQEMQSFENDDDEDNDDDDDDERSTETEEEVHKEIIIDRSRISANVVDGITHNSKSEAETNHGVNVVLHVSNSKQKEVAEEKSDESSTSSYTGDDDSSSSDSRDIEVINETLIVEPVYDRSPSAVEKSLKKFTSLQDALDYLDKQSSKTNSPLASDMEVEISEPGSPSKPNDQNLLSGEEPSPDTNDHWVASSNLSLVDMHESGTMEIKEIKEHDVIKVNYTVTNEKHPNNHIVSPILITKAKENMVTQNFPIMQMEECSKEGGESSHSDGSIKIINTQMPLNRLATGDNLVSHTSFKGQASVEDPIPPSPPSNFGVAESKISILPPIPEEMLEENKHDEGKDEPDVLEMVDIMMAENSVHEGIKSPRGNSTAISSILHTSNEKVEQVIGVQVNRLSNETGDLSSMKKKIECSDSSSTSSSSSNDSG